MTERLHFHFSLSCIGEGNCNPLQCSCLKNPRDGGAWWAAIYGVTQSRIQLKRLSSSSSSIQKWVREFTIHLGPENWEVTTEQGNWWSLPHKWYEEWRSHLLEGSRSFPEGLGKGASWTGEMGGVKKVRQGILWNQRRQYNTLFWPFYLGVNCKPRPLWRSKWQWQGDTLKIFLFLNLFFWTGNTATW